MSEEKTPEIISLGEFLEKAAASDWSSAEIWARGEQYPQLADTLEETKKQFALSSPSEARAALLAALRRAEGELPTQIKNVRPDPEGAPAVTQRTAYIKKVTESFQEAKQKTRASHSRAFTDRLVDNWVNQNKIHIIEETKRAVKRHAAEELEKRPITKTAAREALVTATRAHPELTSVINEKPESIDAAIETERPILARIEHVNRAIDQAAESAFDDQLPEPRLLFAIAKEKATYTNVSIDEIVQKSAGLARAAVAVNANISDLGELSSSGRFFQSFAKSGVAKVVAPAADAMLDMVARINPPAAKAFVEKVIDQSLARVTGSLEKTTRTMMDRIGENAAQSDFFQNTLRRWNQQMEQHRSQTAGITKAKSVLDDVAGTLFGKSIDEGVYNYMELVHHRLAGTNSLPTWQQIHVTGIAQGPPHLVHFEPIGEAGGWALSWLSNIIAQKTGGRVASAVVGATAKEVGKKAIVGLAAKFGLSAFVGAVSGGTSVAIQAAAQAAFWLTGKITGLAGFLFSGQWINGLMSGTGKEDWRKEQSAVIAVIVIGALIVLMLPLFINPQHMYDLVTKTPIAVNVQKKIGEGAGPGVDCEKTPDVPECKLTQCQGDCRWPLDVSTRFCISEGPFVGTHSLSRLSAVDFLTIGSQRSLFGASVYSQYDGTVERAVFGYPDDSGYPGNSDGGTYGNHVVVRTTSGGRLLFAHLRNIQTVRSGESVTAGRVVGFVDHTGYSYDVHLHYEDQSGDINQFLPFPVPPCESVNECDMKLRPAGHSACQ
ncbi:M23 family metallopeptidase [Candidatus Gottesmanbacteria bacterium]|nr:M23 family metallopeptidase [Candidatus Gottesmanbacteria bacterium]